MLGMHMPAAAGQLLLTAGLSFDKEQVDKEQDVIKASSPCCARLCRLAPWFWSPWQLGSSALGQERKLQIQSWKLKVIDVCCRGASCRLRAWRRPRRGESGWPRCAACCSTRRSSSSTSPRSSPRTTTAAPSVPQRPRCRPPPYSP